LVVHHWKSFCHHCGEPIYDFLIECVPLEKQKHPAYGHLLRAEPGAAFACPYCDGLLGFSGMYQPLERPESGRPVFRYGQQELEEKKRSDGVHSGALADWYRNHRLPAPTACTREPFRNYTYASQAPANETVP
jgi:hypothetical protein